MGRITVVTSGKGGAGKTTITAGIGAAAAQRGKSVLLIDGDAGMRSLDLFVGVTENMVFDISDIFSGNCEPIRAIYQCPGTEKLFLLPAPASVDKLVSPELMRKLVKGLSNYYDHIIIDSPAGVGEGFKAAAGAAEEAFVVTTPDPVCIRDAAIIHRELSLIGMHKKHLIINRYSARVIEQGLIPDLDYIIDTAGIQLIGVVPEDVQAAIAAGKGLSARLTGKAGGAFARIAARFEGEYIPLGKMDKY